MRKLRTFLKKLGPGTISDLETLKLLLVEAWDKFEGSDSTNMAAYKLNRIERASWDPPLLEFDIERHGGMPLGSTRAELQTWFVNLKNATAQCATTGRRQIMPMQKRYDARADVDELVNLITSGHQDVKLSWKDGRVTVRMGTILPNGSAVKQTLANRRKRLRNALKERLAEHGWRMVRPNVFEPSKG
jgi:hypothetical protein